MSPAEAFDAAAQAQARRHANPPLVARFLSTTAAAFTPKPRPAANAPRGTAETHYHANS